MKAEYYSSLPVHLRGILKETRRGNFTEVFMNLHGNAPVHGAHATQKKLE